LLFVEPIKVNLAITLSKHEITLGENVTFSLRLSEALSNGTLRVRYSLNNKTWSELEPVVPIDGVVDQTWRPVSPGTYYIYATYSGSGNFGPATSVTVLLQVKSQ
jgi:hypothetical protein